MAAEEVPSHGHLPVLRRVSEVPSDYAGTVPEGLEMIDLPACQMMVFQGPPFDDDDFFETILGVSELIDN